MSTFKKGVFGLIVILASMFAGIVWGGQCISDSAHAYRVYKTIGGKAQQMTFPNAGVKGYKPSRCSSNGAIQAGGPCACFVCPGRDGEKGNVAIRLVFTPISESTIIVAKVSPGGTLLASQTYNAYSDGVIANKENNPCAGLWGAGLEACRAAQEATGGDIGAAVGTVIRAIPGLFGR